MFVAMSNIKPNTGRSTGAVVLTEKVTAESRAIEGGECERGVTVCHPWVNEMGCDCGDGGRGDVVTAGFGLVSAVPVVQSDDSGHKPAPEALCLALGSYECVTE